MTNLMIRKSTMNDLDAMLAIYARARDFMRETGNPNQWNTQWPPAEVIKNDIEGGMNSYVCVDEEGDIVSTFFFTTEPDPCYSNIYEGEWKCTNDYGVVHRIAVSGKHKGVGAYCLNWAYEQCKAAGRHMRIDTHGDNKIMQKLLARLGFEYNGVIYVREDNDPRLAYTKA